MNEDEVMKKKSISIAIVMLIVVSLAVYLVVDHKKEKEAFAEMQISVGYIAETCQNYIINCSIEGDSDYQIRMAQTFARLSFRIYDVIEDNKYVDSEYEFMFYDWIENYNVLFESKLDEKKLRTHFPRIIEYLSSIEEMSHAYKTSEISIDDYILAQSALIKSHNFDFKKKASFNTNGLYEALRRHPDYLSFKNMAIDEILIKDTLYDYFSLFDSDVAKEDIKLTQEGSLAYPISNVDTVMFEYKNTSGMIFANGSFFNINMLDREHDEFKLGKDDESMILKKVEDYLKTIGASDYKYYEINDRGNYNFVNAFRSLDKRSNMDEFRFFFEKKDEIEISRVNYPWQIIKDIYEIAEYEAYYDKKELFDSKLEDYEITDAYFYINTSINQIEFFWKYEVLIQGKTYRITFDARTGMVTEQKCLM